MGKATKVDPTWIKYFVEKFIFAIWTVFIFHFKVELLGIKSQRELKENAIPTLFDHAPLPKKQRKSIEQVQNQTNRQIIEDALFQASEEIEENPPSVQTTTTKNGNSSSW